MIAINAPKERVSLVLILKRSLDLSMATRSFRYSLEAPFIAVIAKNGIRISQLLAIAPTGSISLLANDVSSEY